MAAWWRSVVAAVALGVHAAEVAVDVDLCVDEEQDSDQMSLLAIKKTVRSAHNMAQEPDTCPITEFPLPTYTETLTMLSTAGGFFVELAVPISIHSARVPNDDGVGGPQNIQIMRLHEIPQHGVPLLDSDFTTLWHVNAAATDDAIPVTPSLHLDAGEILGVLGTRGASENRNMLGAELVTPFGELKLLFSLDAQLYDSGTVATEVVHEDDELVIARVELEVSCGRVQTCFCTPKLGFVGPEKLFTDYEVKDGNFVKSSSHEPSATGCTRKTHGCMNCECCTTVAPELQEVNDNFTYGCLHREGLKFVEGTCEECPEPEPDTDR